ncbi:MAG: tRNA preQ1(34) S-adenosylmethionine ribosyltransferase-isomerase QueA [Oscillospiraceae bacterium]
MQRSLFNYHLPKELIAQHPAEPRDSSRLLCLDRDTGKIFDNTFRDIQSLLRKGDLLVINDSKVLPARLLGSKSTGAKAELLLLKPLSNDHWECLAKPGRRLKTGSEILFEQGLSCIIKGETEDGNRIAEFFYDHSRSFYDLLDSVGMMPLPHYITEPLRDSSQYQTVYADEPGSAAAPTAGLHFTDELLDNIKALGVGIARVTLHVGLGTFRPVKENEIEHHLMHTEHYSITGETADAINSTKASGGRVIAVGTTSCRTLESAADDCGFFHECASDTSIFIYPGYKFKAMDGLITNFHLPESTLIMLVSAFAGYEHTMAAYRHAVDACYRFYSFGDAMFIASGLD